ncbi:MAG: TlpA family protein disulfide reductase [Ilumatobacteraceae bacterium]
MSSAFVAVGVFVVVAAIALVARRRQVVDVPTQKSWTVPQQDPADFPASRGESWTVVVFTSSSCHVCADVAAKALVLASSEVSVYEVEYTSRRELHTKYGIDAVPTLLVADREGVVRHHSLGPVTATDLWAAVARVRDPDLPVVEGGCAAHEHDVDH